MKTVPFIDKTTIRRVIREQIFKSYPDDSPQLPLDIEDFVEIRLGIPLHIVQLHKSILGYANIEENAIYINVMIENQQTRFRFTVAHELGHLTLHKDLIQREGQFLTTLKQPLLTSENERRVEYQANLYAGELLAPIGYIHNLYENRFKAIMEQVDEKKKILPASEMVRTVAKDCEVSRSCAVVRLKDYFGNVYPWKLFR